MGVPCAATEMTIPPTVLGRRHMIARLRYFCERKEKQTTNDEEEQLCAEGNQLIQWTKQMSEKMIDLRGNKDRDELLEWTRKASELLDPCRWIECRPEGSTNVLTRANHQLADWKQAWNEFETKVRKMNGMC